MGGRLRLALRVSGFGRLGFGAFGAGWEADGFGGLDAKEVAEGAEDAAEARIGGEEGGHLGVGEEEMGKLAGMAADAVAEQARQPAEMARQGGFGWGGG